MLAIASSPARAHTQQPFVVDDAEVTPRGGVHVEVSDQVNRLRPSARPARWQNTFDPEVDVGLPGRLELGVAVPAISLLRDRTIGGGAIHGIGDSTLAIKWRMTPAPDATLSWAASAFVGLPTGSFKRGLGSALVDYGVNVVTQAHLPGEWTLRGNAGGILVGNEQTGALGIRVQGPVLTAGTSVVRAVGQAQVGGEFFLAWSPNATLGGSNAGGQIGGNVPLGERATLDLGVGVGGLSASPRWWFQAGLSVDVVRR